MMASLARRPATWAWATALWLAILARPAEDSPDRHLGAPMFELGGEHFLSGLYPRRGSGLHDMPLVKRLARELSRFILRPEILDGPSRFSRRCTEHRARSVHHVPWALADHGHAGVLCQASIFA